MHSRDEATSMAAHDRFPFSLLQQPLQPVEVALHESCIGGELRVRHSGFAKEREQQLAATAVDNQSHGNINALTGRPNYGVIHHAKVVPRREANPRYTAVGVGNPAFLRWSNVLAQSESPLVPIGGV